MSPEEFESYYKEARNNHFIKPYDIAYKSFIELGYDNEDLDFFIDNASAIIERLRQRSWDNYLIAEDLFSRDMYKYLAESGSYTNFEPVEAIKKYIDDNSEKFYKLSLSNTQSRRSRAGTEFEAIIELLLMGAGITLDSQGSLASGIFENHDLGKAVDLVSPGVLEYSKQKRRVALISCKTTLRERWTEVIEEKNRTGASEVFLANLDDKISSDTLNQLNINNVIPVVTKELKDRKYSTMDNVITYEELMEDLASHNSYWNPSRYSNDEKETRKEFILNQISYHEEKEHEFVVGFYNDLLSKFS